MKDKLPRFCFHLAEQDNWPPIQRSGLLSASRLMDRAGLNGAARKAMELCRREQRTVSPDGTLVRDNKPLPLVSLERRLVGMRSAEWFALLNSKVSFWFDLSRLERQRRAYGTHLQVVLVFETAALVAKHETMSSVTPAHNFVRQSAATGHSACSLQARVLMLCRSRRADVVTIHGKVQDEAAGGPVVFGLANDDGKQAELPETFQPGVQVTSMRDVIS